jgi:hypothetical protein
MRLMYTTALASALMFAGPALAAGDGDHVKGATGMTAPESSAAQLPGHSADSADLRQSFEGAGFSDWQSADNAEIYRMQSGDGQPVWVLLMPESFQVGSVDSDSELQGEAETGDLAAAPQPPPDSDAAAMSGSGQRGDRADIGETFGQPESGGQADAAEAPEQPEVGEQADIAEAPEQPEMSEQADAAEAPELPEAGEQADIAEAPEQPEAGEQADVAEAPELPEAGDLPEIAGTPGAPEVGESGTAGETQPEGFAAEIPGELRSGFESAGFQQVESVDGANLFRAKTDDGRLAFIIVGDLGAAGSGLDQQQAPGLDQQQPGAAPDIPDITPDNAPTPEGQQQ